MHWEAFDNSFVGYDDGELNATARLVASLKQAIPLLGHSYGGHWVVIGSISPWVEAALLELGIASRITTLEYSNLAACPDMHPNIHPTLPAEFSQQYLSEERFDGFVQYSSLEHSGLGMYGDEINPWADGQTVAAMWCRGKAASWFVFGPGPEGPGGATWGRVLHSENRAGRHSGSPFEEKLYWNAGRDWGREMLGRLMLNWELVRPANDTWSMHLFRRVEQGAGYPGSA